MVFNWSGSGAKGINSDIEDTDSRIEEAILQMDVFHFDDDDNDNDNRPAGTVGMTFQSCDHVDSIT